METTKQKLESLKAKVENNELDKQLILNVVNEAIFTIGDLDQQLIDKEIAVQQAVTKIAGQLDDERVAHSADNAAKDAEILNITNMFSK